MLCEPNESKIVSHINLTKGGLRSVIALTGFSFGF